MMGVFARWKPICQGEGWPSPASAGPLASSIAPAPISISFRSKIAIPSLPEPSLHSYVAA